MSWLKSILAILGSLFKVIDKKTWSYEEKVDKINRDKKEQIKDDWKDTQNEIDNLKLIDSSKAKTISFKLSIALST